MAEKPSAKKVDGDDAEQDAAAFGNLGARAPLEHALVYSEN